MKCIVALNLLLFCSLSYSAPIRVAAFGDAPYFLPEGYTMLETLIKQAHQARPHLAVQVGDILGTQCSKEVISKIKNYFSNFKVPLVYTPGNNEWTDCHRKTMGGFEPKERRVIAPLQGPLTRLV